MNKALVSVIIPIYNVSSYLDTCVESVCSQTYQNLEIILVDDGSKDDCPAKCDAWAEKDSRIKVIHKPNGGLSDARNAGLDAAIGKYVYFLDGDDFIKPELVETAVKHMESGMDMVAFQYDIVLSDGQIKPVYYHELGLYRLDDANRTSFIIEKILTGKLGWEAWSRMYAREPIERYHLRFADNRAIFAEDLYFCLCYCAHVSCVGSIADSLYYYVKRDDSIMGQDSVKLNVGRMNELAKEALAFFERCSDCQDLIRHFPIIHYLIVDNVFRTALYRNVKPIEAFRNDVLEDISDLHFFRCQMKQLPRYYKQLNRLYPMNRVAERISLVRYLLNGSMFAYRVRNKLIYHFGEAIDHGSSANKALTKAYKRSPKKRVFLLGTEEYGNIGDNQINESTVDFLKHTLPEYAVFEVTAMEMDRHFPFLKRYIRDDDMIVFAGGGNFGDVYPAAHDLRAKVIKTWQSNPKIVFPQTIHFTDSDQGRAALEETRKLYTNDNRVELFTRDQRSFDLAKQMFSCNSYLVPDIVLSADMQRQAVRNEEILICLRSDIEKSLSKEDAERIYTICKTAGVGVRTTDLQLPYHVRRNDRVAAINQKLDQWRSAKLVITDRLHGMVFAAVTGTPCIVLSNYNHKVRGTYEWIKYLPYIRYAESIADVEKHMTELLNAENCMYDIVPLQHYFDQLAKVVKKYAAN